MFEKLKVKGFMTSWSVYARNQQPIGLRWPGVPGNVHRFELFTETDAPNYQFPNVIAVHNPETSYALAQTSSSPKGLGLFVGGSKAVGVHRQPVAVHSR